MIDVYVSLDFGCVQVGFLLGAGNLPLTFPLVRLP